VSAPEPSPAGLRPRAILIGPMAAGKTSVGRALARLWHVPFVDLDHEVEARHGPIPEIFAAHGESGFREREADALAQLLGRHGGVLSLGGGAPLTPRSAASLAGHHVVLIEIDEHAAASRLRGGAGRPLLAGEDPVLRWRTITAARMPAYRALAVHTVDGASSTPDALARSIAAALDDPRQIPQEDA